MKPWELKILLTRCTSSIVKLYGHLSLIYLLWRFKQMSERVFKKILESNIEARQTKQDQMIALLSCF